jgi:hypothetical protein
VIGSPATLPAAPLRAGSSGAGGTLLDRLPKALGPDARRLVDEMGDEAAAALQVGGRVLLPGGVVAAWD